jgi:hypothetical protein
MTCRTIRPRAAPSALRTTNSWSRAVSSVNEPGADREQGERALRAVRQMRAQRHGVRADRAIGLGMLRRELPGDRVELRLRLRPRPARTQPGDDVPIAGAANARLVLFERGLQCPLVEPAAEHARFERCRQNADDLERFGVHPDRPADDVRNAAEVPLPCGVAQDDDVAPVPVVVAAGQAAVLRLHAEGVEEPFGHLGAGQNQRLGAARVITAVRHRGRDVHPRRARVPVEEVAG